MPRAMQQAHGRLLRAFSQNSQEKGSGRQTAHISIDGAVAVRALDRGLHIRRRSLWFVKADMERMCSGLGYRIMAKADGALGP